MINMEAVKTELTKRETDYYFQVDLLDEKQRSERCACMCSGGGSG